MAKSTTVLKYMLIDKNRGVLILKFTYAITAVKVCERLQCVVLQKL